jgi:hypothetical protein
MAVSVDSPVPPPVAAEIEGIEAFEQAWFVTLDVE